MLFAPVEIILCQSYFLTQRSAVECLTNKLRFGGVDTSFLQYRNYVAGYTHLSAGSQLLFCSDVYLHTERLFRSDARNQYSHTNRVTVQ